MFNNSFSVNEFGGVGSDVRGSQDYLLRRRGRRSDVDSDLMGIRAVEREREEQRFRRETRLRAVRASMMREEHFRRNPGARRWLQYFDPVAVQAGRVAAQRDRESRLFNAIASRLTSGGAERYRADDSYDEFPLFHGRKF